jgi:hypothetical protein
LSDDVILECFLELPEITKIPNYKNLIIKKIEEIKESMKEKIPGLAEELPKIESLELK